MRSMNVLGELSPQQFINDIWQQRAHVFRQVISESEGLIDGDELAALACDTQIESRFIFSNADETQWQVEHGPFPEERFEDLPDSRWTLMVQSVDHWLPEMHELLGHFNFLPRWRVDDILATYACNGGGVGPHFDYYDVFLIQAQGRRKWRIGQHCDENSALQNNSDVKLLENFEGVEEFILEPGDMLYIPPKYAHWGTAIGDDCITLSVGFRAPSEADMHTELAIERGGSEDKRFEDTPHSIDADPYCINEAAIAQIGELVATPQAGAEKITASFAKLVTEPRHLGIIQADENTVSNRELEAFSKQTNHFTIELDAACRCAYIDNGDQADLYLNGECYAVSLNFAQQFCKQSIAPQLLSDSRYQTLLADWLKRGFIYSEAE